MGREMRALVALAALKIAAAIALRVAAAPAVTVPGHLALPGWVHGIFLAVFTATGALLVLGGRRDPRARWLGIDFLLLGTFFADGLVRQRVAESPALTMLLACQVIAFHPYAFWCFARDFPQALVDDGARRRRIGWSLLAIGCLLFAVNLATLFPAYRHSGVFDQWGSWLHPHTANSQLWTLLLIAQFPSFASMLTRVRRARPAERRRVALFVGAVTIALAPVTIQVVLTSTSPALDRWLDDPWTFRVVGVIEAAFLLLLPLATAWAVVVEPMFDVRVVVRRAIRYALARYSILMVLAALPAWLVVRLWQQRDMPLTVIVASAAWAETLGVVIAAAGLLVVRKPLLAAVDRRFFREHHDAQSILLHITGAVRHATSVRELSDLVVSALDRALHLDRAGLLVRNADDSLLVDPLGRVRPLSWTSPLRTAVEGAPAPLPIDLSHQDLMLDRLPAGDREWLADAGARLIVSVSGDDGRQVGLLLLGEKRSELAYSHEDRLLLSAVAAAVGPALERRLRAETPSLARRAPVDDAAEASQCVACGEVLERSAASCTVCGGRLQAAMLPATYASRFRLHRQIGAGGMGVVYRATDNLGRTVALKTLPRVSPENAARLRREARALAALDHENLVSLFEYDLWRGTPVLVLEYLPGGTLADRLRHGPLPCGEVVSIGLAMCDALAYLHRRGFLHRDIKPSNIGFSSRDTPKLLDFGLVHLVADVRAAPGADTITGPSPVLPAADFDESSVRGILIGTPAYLSPEATRLMTPEPSFDLWSLAVTLYEAMTGVPPFRATTASELFARIVRAEVVDPRVLRPDCPAAFADLVRTALAPTPRHRFRSAASLGAALRTMGSG